jgi:hypothetical protein
LPSNVVPSGPNKGWSRRKGGGREDEEEGWREGEGASATPRQRGAKFQWREEQMFPYVARREAWREGGREGGREGMHAAW